jgi:hypothetical protein
MFLRSLTFPETVVPVGIGHIIKLLAQLHEPIHQSLHDQEMGIGLSSAMDDQELAFQSFGKVDRGRFAVSVRVPLSGEGL